MFLHHLVEFNGVPWTALNHHWHGVNVLSVLECCLLAGLLCSVLTVLLRRSRRLRVAAVIGSLFFATAAYAANTALSALSASGALAGANLIYVVQSVGSGGVKATMTQVATFINSLFSGDATVASGGAVTLATVNANVGSFGSATTCTAFTTNAKGLITAASAVTCTPAMSSVTGRAALSQLPQGIANSIWINPTGSTADMQNVAVPACANDGSHGLVYVNGSGLACATMTGGVTFANPTGTAGPTANNGVATTAMRSDATPAIQQGSASQKGIVQVDGATLLATAGVLSAATPTLPTRVQSGTNYPIVSTDQASLIYLSNSTNQTPTIPSGATLGPNWFTQLCNDNTGIQTITPAGGTIGGGSTYPLPAGTPAAPKCVALVSDGTNLKIYIDGAPLNGTNTWTGTNTFGTVFGSINPQSGTTYTLAATDCGKTVVITNASAITLTTLNSIPAGCSIAVEQGGAGQITVANGAGATLTSSHSYTKTFNAAGAIIGLFVDTNGGTNAHYVLTGDGA